MFKVILGSVAVLRPACANETLPERLYYYFSSSKITATQLHAVLNLWKNMIFFLFVF